MFIWRKYILFLFTSKQKIKKTALNKESLLSKQIKETVIT